MHLRSLIQFILPSTILAQYFDSSLGSTLNVTVLGARHNRSTLECWALQPGFETSDQPGQVGTATLNLDAIGGNASFAVLPAGFDGGRHNAPALQWVVFLSGLAHITLPTSTTEAWIEGGKNGAILALDTADVSALGHFTTYPSQERTTSVVIPLGKKGVPGHRVLHEGPCQEEEEELIEN
ncbi:WD40 repeat-like protein [Penicillium digitatum]|uniref:Small secreted protein n=3 Tax=Penicillium digitatum TaxID=36651 RepID=K9FV25_PEND2|nr:hypothetical protein PDIP_32910 [Penicillium digitatum Pd1]EKV04891.1 hypothetical protein PDIG_86920 [Penicillium digitatum PHI26]EKV17092.1 hypothetical protein PDIP_32910 [Penicillium digitatum Pd1]KAG0160160.1 hypothetical protein PDIDSM_7687 [Penicillium digitatum]QQK45742.1 WD40 repeat-like protein [Penicillium digitatum]